VVVDGLLVEGAQAVEAGAGGQDFLVAGADLVPAVAALDLGGVGLEREDVEADVGEREAGDLARGDDAFPGLAGEAECVARNSPSPGP
jgi:hypothetical protein